MFSNLSAPACASCGVWQISKRSWEKDKQKGGARTALHAQQQQQNARNTRNARTQHTQQTQCTHAQQQHGERDILLRTGIYLTPALSFRRRRRPVISGWIGFGIGFGKPPFIVVPAAVAKNHPRNRVPQLLAAPKTCRGTQNNANAPV